MPRKPMQLKKERRKLTPAEEAYLRDDDGGFLEKSMDGFALWCYRHAMPAWDGTKHPREIWEKNKDEFLPEFIKNHLTKRSLAWWQWDCPRQPDHGSGFWYEGTLPEPRRQIAGKGELQKGYVPFYQYGIPQHWDAKTLDASDPLVFESQTSFLLRNNILTESEKKYLAGHPELLEPEAVTFEAEN